MQAGKLRHRITIQKLVHKTDCNGNPVKEWVDVTTVYADKRGLSGRLYYQAAAVQAENDVLYVIRYRPDVKAKMRVVDDGEYTIKSAIDKDGRKQWLELRCSGDGS